jgi:hypothetical protein
MTAKAWCRLFTLASIVLISSQASVLGQDGKSSIPTVSATDMKDWMRQVSDAARGGSNSTDPSSSLAMLEKMRFYLGASSNIEEFRRNDDQKVISRLASLASADDSGLRFNAASILANVTDNTTLCVVLEKILDRNIDVAARFNLLQTVKVVSTFSTRDNSYWIRSTVNQVRLWSEGRKDSDRTLQVLGQIEQLLDTQKEQFRVSSLPMLAPAQYKECVQLPSIALFEAARSAYTIYVHTKGPTLDAAKPPKAVLTEAGFSYGGEDQKEDTAGGRAIDYSTQGNRKANQDIAQFVADTINAHFFHPPPPNLPAGVIVRPQPSMAEKSVVVWF